MSVEILFGYLVLIWSEFLVFWLVYCIVLFLVKGKLISMRINKVDKEIL